MTSAQFRGFFVALRAPQDDYGARRRILNLKPET
jgi:hypothetical protein